ncbi:MAG: DegV family protein [Lachnospiraceae bacterium]|nr:DegV family protein [Lachnospiraceae bacterium]
MNSIAILTDSNSGITQTQAKELGIFVIPMPFMIDGKNYLEDIDLTQADFYRMLEDNSDIHTSQPAPGDIMGTWDKILKDYDQIVYIPMSSGLSSTCSNASIYARDYEDRVFVVNNQRISVTQRQSAIDAYVMAQNGIPAPEIKKILEETKFDSSIYITLDTLKYLKKGGRITPAATAFAEILNLKPILQIQGEKLDSFSKCRGIKQAKNIMINAIKNDIDHRFGGIDTSHPNCFLCIAHTNNYEAAEVFKSEIEAAFPGYPVHVDPLSLSIACHIGPGSIAMACARVIPQGQQIQ